jgi:hypothetical protein
MNYRIYTIKIVHTLGHETIEINAISRDGAVIQARNYALAEGLILLRCYVAS